MRPSTLADFSTALEAAVTRELDRRPSGRPPPLGVQGLAAECGVFLVGLNPATHDAGFGPYWSDTGFNYTGWLNGYLRSRADRGKAGQSRTRRRIDIFTPAAEAEGAAVLETNLYAV